MKKNSVKAWNIITRISFIAALLKLVQAKSISEYYFKRTN